MCRSLAVRVRLVGQQTAEGCAVGRRIIDTGFPCIGNCCARPRGLQKIAYFNWGSTCRKVWEPLC